MEMRRGPRLFRRENLGNIFIQMMFKTMSLDEITKRLSIVREKAQEMSTEGLQLFEIRQRKNKES